MTEPTPQWTFESIVTNPAGVRVCVTVRVPDSSPWLQVGECGELAEMAAKQTITRVEKSLHENEVPFR